MRSIRLRLPILAMTVLASSFVPTRAAEVLYLDTVNWIPTASVLTLPTSYVVASSYVVPTSYAVPTVYATAYATETALLTPTTYVAPTYYETRFRRTGLFGRRLVETTRAYYIPTTAYYPTTYYYPTTFYSPTVLDTAVVPTGFAIASASTTACCGEVVTAPAVRSLPSEQAPASTTPAPRRSQRSRPSRIESEPTEDESINSNVEPAPALPPREPRPESSKATEGRSDSPPAPPVPTREQSTVPRPGSPPARTKSAAPATGFPTGTGPGGASGQPKNSSSRTPPESSAPTGSGDQPPLAPAGGDDLQPAPSNDEKAGSGYRTLRRDSQRPVLTAPRSLRSQLRNVLFGRVKSRDTNEPEEGVRVTISNRMNAYEDRVTLTDAFGRFAVKVPDGDWTVNVSMPSGRVYSVSQITVSNGLITDDIGRDIPSLVITR
jgi:hypothetical protein